MRKKIKKWGNSLAIRIPKPFAAEIGLEEDSPVELAVINDQLVIIPRQEEPVELESMLKQVTEENKHGEVKTGPVMGREAW
ncbi:MAG: AbrB/MazE/SpoVT family DNA-binding domain-containing protein [Anaerolineales bacterium]|nr:AbrB/MazE/SpoVT family DNA-binding domain-containing protein [Anaerolineales bacterium]